MKMPCPVCNQTHGTREPTSSCCDVEYLWGLLSKVKRSLHNMEEAAADIRRKNERLLEVFKGAKGLRDTLGPVTRDACHALFDAVREVEEG